MAKRPAKTKAPSSTRASWKGNLTFGLVSFTVEAFNALDRQASDIHFHQLHAKCHKRIHYAKMCPVHGQVPNDEIVSGYEFAKDQYVEVSPDELDALRTEKERALTIDAFIAPDTIDPLYFDGRMYYLLPAAKSGQEAYAVVVAAMAHEKRYGIGEIVFSGKDQLALIRPVEDVLHMALLNFDTEIRKPEFMAEALTEVRPAARQVKLAQELVRNWTVEKFDFSQYTDSYRERVEKLVDAKSKGKTPKPPAEESEPPATINLMDALKKSLGRSSPAGKSRAAPKKKRTA